MGKRNGGVFNCLASGDTQNMSGIFNFLLPYFPKELKYKSQKFFTSYSS